MGARRWVITSLGQGKMRYSLRVKCQEIILYDFRVLLGGSETLEKVIRKLWMSWSCVVYILNPNSLVTGHCPVYHSICQGLRFRSMILHKFKDTYGLLLAPAKYNLLYIQFFFLLGGQTLIPIIIYHCNTIVVVTQRLSSKSASAQKLVTLRCR